MNKFVLAAASVLVLSVSAPAFAGGCCDGVPAPVQSMMILSSGEQPASMQDAPAASAGAESIAPAAGDMQDGAQQDNGTSAAPSSESAPEAAPAAAEGEQAPSEPAAQ